MSPPKSCFWFEVLKWLKCIQRIKSCMVPYLPSFLAPGSSQSRRQVSGDQREPQQVVGVLAPQTGSDCNIKFKLYKTKINIYKTKINFTNFSLWYWFSTIHGRGRWSLAAAEILPGLGSPIASATRSGEWFAWCWSPQRILWPCCHTSMTCGMDKDPENEL